MAFTFDMDAESLMHLYFNDTAPNRVGMAAMLRSTTRRWRCRVSSTSSPLRLRQTFSFPGWSVEPSADSRRS